MAAFPVPSHAQLAAAKRDRDSFFITTGILTGLGTVVVLLRLGWRHFKTRTLGMDDLFMAMAWALDMGFLGEMICAKHNGLGRFMAELTLKQMTTFLKEVLAVQVTYYSIIYCIKMSIVFLYLRFAVSKTTRRLCYGTTVLLTVFWVICCIVTLAQCVPMRKEWDLTGTVKGYCIDGTAFFYFTSSFNIVTDMWILYLPIKTLWSMHRPGREKVAITLIFGMGVFSCIASIVRLQSIYKYTLTTDPFRNAIPVNLWSVIEINVGIVCAALPALRQMLAMLSRHVSQLSTELRSRRRASEEEEQGEGRRKRTIGQISVKKERPAEDSFGSRFTEDAASLSVKSNAPDNEEKRDRLDMDGNEKRVTGMHSMRDVEAEAGATAEAELPSFGKI